MRDLAGEMWTYVVLVTFGAIGALCFILTIANLPLWEAKKPEWIGALGTIAAFLGTIWIATNETRRRRRETGDLAVLVCIGMSNDLQWLIDQLAITDELDRDYPVGNIQSWKGAADAISNRCHWSDEQITKLVCVGGKTAERIVLARAQILSGTNNLRSFAAMAGSSMQDKYKADCIRNFRQARHNLNLATRRMVSFVESRTARADL